MHTEHGSNDVCCICKVEGKQLKAPRITSWTEDNPGRRFYGCRNWKVWELTGIPCSHAIAAFYSSSMEPLSVMSKWYHRETYRKCYEHAIQPIPGVKFWTVKENEAIEPPPVEKKVGRPKKNRVRASNEPRLKHKLSRKGKVQHCSLCGSIAHKKDKCPQRPSQLSKESQASTSSKSRRGSHAGLGLYVNIETGKQVLNPGGSQSIVINEGTQRESDPNTRFSIPNEAQLRKEKRKREPSKKQATEPFKAPRKKKEDDKQQHILRRSPRGKNATSTVGSTTTS